MDVASPRYADDPTLALRQMSFMSVDDSSFDPEVAHEHTIAERRMTYEELLSGSGWLRRRRLRRIHRIIELFAGTRDTPKHHLVMVNYAMRKRVLIEGEKLVENGRLDAAELADGQMVEVDGTAGIVRTLPSAPVATSEEVDEIVGPVDG